VKIAIIDYGLGNLHSVLGAVRKVGYDAIITNNGSDILNSDRVILPGVGSFAEGMNNIKNLKLIDPLNKFVNVIKKPILGICLGFQLLANESFEFGHHRGLGWVDASVEKLNLEDKIIRIPHIGWNDHLKCNNSILWDGIPDEALFYYVHSYHMKCKNEKIIIGKCTYGTKFVSAIQQKNIYATQFHPEKSQFYGLEILKNFIEKSGHVKK